jgi:hypothetical protein
VTLINGVTLAESLINGRDAYIESEKEWAMVNDPNEKIKGYGMVELIYDKIKQYEDDVMNYIKAHGFWGCDDTIGKMHSVFKIYNGEARGALLLLREVSPSLVKGK